MAQGDQGISEGSDLAPVVREADPAELAEDEERRKPVPGPTPIRMWATKFAHGDDFDAPETRGLALAGTWPDGQMRVSSAIVAKLAPRLFRTASGSHYRLEGDPHPEFAAFCERIGKPLDLDDPVKFIRRPPERDDAPGGEE